MNRLIRPLCIAALVSWGSGCQSQATKQPAEPAPTAPAKGDLRSQVEALLSGYERVPTAEDWKRLGPEALEVLEAIFQDPKALPSTRTRAVASMALVDNPAAVQRLVAISADSSVDEQYRSTAALALGRRGGPGAFEAVQPLLDDPSARVRDAAARALGSLGTPKARQVLELRLEKEEDPVVREAIQRSLTKLEP